MSMRTVNKLGYVFIACPQTPLEVVQFYEQLLLEPLYYLCKMLPGSGVNIVPPGVT